MAQGFALVALRRGRRAKERGISDDMLGKIEDLAKRAPGIVAADARPIKRLHGSEMVVPFNVRIDVKGSNLKAAFAYIENRLHQKKLSHAEGYGG